MLRHYCSVTPIKGVGRGRSIVDMCLAFASSTWHVFQDVLLVCEFLITLFTMILVEQWRFSIDCFYPLMVGRKCVIDENLCETRRDNVNC